VAISLMSNGVTLSLIVAGYYILINQFENHVIYPLVVRKIVGIPPILVIIALIVGYELAGLIGVIIAVPMAAVLVEFLDDVQKRKNVLQTKVARSES
jgi:predicted PurR-regulated permease PerM